MKIALCHSMQFAERAKEVSEWFKDRGHEAYPSSFNDQYLGLTDDEKEKLKLFYKYEKGFEVYKKNNLGRSFCDMASK